MTSAAIAYCALCIAVLGILGRIGRWFWLQIGPENPEGPSLRGAARSFAMAIKALFRTGIGSSARSLVADTLLQIHILKQDWRRWVMHMALFYGMVMLVVLHALDNFTIMPFDGNYAPTLNPWRFLRNLGAILVLAGILIAVCRCRTNPIRKRTRTTADRLARWLLATLVVTGILLESVQFLSPAIFDAMVDDYAFSDDPQEIEALKAYWSYSWGSGVTSALPIGDPQTLALGQEMHEAFCAACHDRPQSAWLSYPVSRALKPLAGLLDRLGLEGLLWHLHFISACLALALLPFSKFFHLLATPISLMMRAGGPAGTTASALRPVRRAVGLDACTHCGVCSEHCAVAVIYQAIPNPAILPSEKIGALKRWAVDACAPLAINLAEGSFVCTACGRCTQWCPSGIDLQDLWRASQKDLALRGLGPVHDWIRSQNAAQWAAKARSAPLRPALRAHTLGLSDDPETFWACIQCTTCTNVCPVVAVTEDVHRDLDLTPQQVMNLMRLQLRELALGARMVWDCATCYQCQEHCPQGVRVADILYELRNEAIRRLQVWEHRAKGPEEVQREA